MLLSSIPFSILLQWFSFCLHAHTHAHTRTLSNGANGLIRDGDMLIIHTYTLTASERYDTNTRKDT